MLPLDTSSIINQQQLTIGWDWLVDGWLLLAWQDHQDHYWSFGKT